jgi:glycosyltransferase involved in cell wall biosynthesis
MNVLFCNSRYFPSAGPETYMFITMRQLEQHGHQAFPLSVAWEQNIPNPYQSYFVAPPVDSTSVFFHQYRDRLTLSRQWKMFATAAYSKEAKDAAKRMIEDFKIDVMYTLHIVNVLSPSIIDAAAEMGIPSVMFLPDFNLLCPAYLYFRDNHVCMECQQGLRHAVQHRCLQHSAPVTLARVLAMKEHARRGVYDRVSAFVAPSRFLAEQMEQFPAARGKIHYVPGYAENDRITPTYANRGYFLFFGRVARDKGVDWLIQAHGRLSPSAPLIIAGTIADGEHERLTALMTPEQHELVQFVGFQTGQALQDLIEGATAVIQPSRWHDNSPNSVFEALAHGKPVLGSRLGGVADQITEDCGFLVEAGDDVALAGHMQQLVNDPALALRLGHGARRRAETEFHPERHYERLMRVFAIAGASVPAVSTNE